MCSDEVVVMRAQNAWTDAEVDTRNVLVHEFIVEVRDVQDTSPYFLTAPPVTTLPETAKEVMTCSRHLVRKKVNNFSLSLQGDSVLQVSAFDGDYAHPRRIRYGLDPSGLPFSSYFAIHPDTGIVTVRKSLMVCNSFLFSKNLAANHSIIWLTRTSRLVSTVP